MILLSAGHLRAEVDPAYGGRVTRFWDDATGWDWLAPTPAAGREPLVTLPAGCFPLVPFSNKMGFARFPFGGKTIELTVFPPENAPHRMHGNGHRRGWDVLATTPSTCEIGFTADFADWPFPFTARQAISLTPAGLTVAISATNTGQTDMPIGIGLHPYFRRTPDIRIRADFGGVWISKQPLPPTERSAVPPEMDLSAAPTLGTRSYTNGFDGWDGTADIIWPAAGRHLTMQSSPTLRHCIVHLPEGQDYLCIEPVSHAINAFNLGPSGVAGTGYTVLAPGETLAGSMLLAPN